MIEIGLHALGAVEEELHEGGAFFQQSMARAAAVRAAQVRLEVPVEVFVGVALRRVGRQVEHLNLVPMRLYPCGDLLGMVCPQVVQNEEHLVPFADLHETLHEAQCRLGGRCAFSASRDIFRASILSMINRLNVLINHCHLNIIN